MMRLPNRNAHWGRCWLRWRLVAHLACLAAAVGAPRGATAATTRPALDASEHIRAHREAQRVVEGQLIATNVTALPCAQPRTHGRVEKAATGRAAAALALRPAAAAPLVAAGLPLYWGCKVRTCSRMTAEWLASEGPEHGSAMQASYLAVRLQHLRFDFARAQLHAATRNNLMLADLS